MAAKEGHRYVHPRREWVYRSWRCEVYRACRNNGGFAGYYEKERKPLWSVLVGNVLGVIGIGGWAVGRIWIGFFTFTSWMRGDLELVFAGVAMRSFLLGVIRRSDLRSCSLMLFFFFRPIFYTSFLNISPTLVKERKILQWGHMRHIYNTGRFLLASPAYNTRQLVIIYLYLYYRKTWNLFILLIS